MTVTPIALATQVVLVTVTRMPELMGMQPVVVVAPMLSVGLALVQEQP